MGCCCSCLNPKSKLSPLQQAKLMTKTKYNKMISRELLSNLRTRAEQRKVFNSFELKIILAEYSDFTQIYLHLYLTGIGGMNQENIRDHGIKCIVNVTFEIGTYNLRGIQTIRIPVEDSEKENISVYFDEVSDQIEKWISHSMRVVVHCLCGISRSTTLVLAYMMKHKGMTLRAAFRYVIARRPCIQPNNAFFQQLVDYETKLFKKNTVKMIYIKNKKGKMVKCPDILHQMFPQKTETETGEETMDTILTATATTRLDSIF